MELSLKEDYKFSHERKKITLAKDTKLKFKKKMNEEMVLCETKDGVIVAVNRKILDGFIPL